MRISQSYLSRIINGKFDPPMDILAMLSLVLLLTPDEARDFASRACRAYSPVLPVHDAYIYLFDIYHARGFDYFRTTNPDYEDFLREADTYLVDRNLPGFPKG